MSISSHIWGLDFETYSDVDLPTHGRDRYMSSPNFRPLIAVLTDGSGSTHDYDFVLDPDATKRFQNRLMWLSGRGVTLGAHNADFERDVLRHMFGVEFTSYLRIVDTAVFTRASGGSSSLEASAKQLLPSQRKLESGKSLIQLFCVPHYEEDEEKGPKPFDKTLVHKNLATWSGAFKDYCEQDAALSAAYLNLWQSEFYGYLGQKEMINNERVTSEMNFTGWPVNVKNVERMLELSERNTAKALEDFRRTIDSEQSRWHLDPMTGEVTIDPPLNFNSTPQLKRWCAARGVRAKSFDALHVDKLLARLKVKIASTNIAPDKQRCYAEIHAMLEVKKLLGGSALKKLQVILDTVGEDGRLRDQYVHVGAGQSYRTTGRSVQLQNLKRLGGEGRNMADLWDEAMEWTNTDLAENLRQVFEAQHPNGELIVGDLSSIESRGLAAVAGAKWKTEAFARGLDMYKVQATKIYSVAYDAVTKAQRSTGKVGELGCGYNAGGAALKDFAEKMGVDMTLQEAKDLVLSWRDTNPEVVKMWGDLDKMLHDFMTGTSPHQFADLDSGVRVEIRDIPVPRALEELLPPEAQGDVMKSAEIKVVIPELKLTYCRVIHGLYRLDGKICYHKPSTAVNGPPWIKEYRNPKTKRLTRYSIYGGKLTGILIQSACRELFFDILRRVQRAFKDTVNVQVIGQFHDEIVLEWTPPSAFPDTPAEFLTGLGSAKVTLRQLMSASPSSSFLPMDAEVHSAKTYVK